jgi:hypothetical protein
MLQNIIPVQDQITPTPGVLSALDRLNQLKKPSVLAELPSPTPATKEDIQMLERSMNLGAVDYPQAEAVLPEMGTFVPPIFTPEVVTSTSPVSAFSDIKPLTLPSQPIIQEPVSQPIPINQFIPNQPPLSPIQTEISQQAPKREQPSTIVVKPQPQPPTTIETVSIQASMSKKTPINTIVSFFRKDPKTVIDPILKITKNGAVSGADLLEIRYVSELKAKEGDR